MQNPKTISMHDLKEKLGKLGPNELILDVRTPQEFAEGHVPGAKNIDHENVADRADELRKYKTVYIHCRSGKRAQIAFKALELSGLENLVCIGGSGMMDWVAAGYPVE